MVLGIGLAKGEALDGVMRQATEMGVQRLIPFVSERSERVPRSGPGGAGSAGSAWPGRASNPASVRCCPRSSRCRILPAALNGPEEVKLIFWEEERGGGLKSLLSAAPAPGRQGAHRAGRGLFAPEADLAREAGFHVASLGPRRLKVATAALAALTLLQYAWGDLA